MKKNQRLSLADFKMNKLDNRNEIDKLLGGLAAACHWTGPHKTENDDPNGDSVLIDYEWDKGIVDSNDPDELKRLVESGELK